LEYFCGHKDKLKSIEINNIMDEDDHDSENPLDRKSKVYYNNFMLELTSNGYINREDLAKQFKLDVDSYTDKNGLFVVQDGKILRKPFDISLSTRKINEQIGTWI